MVHKTCHVFRITFRFVDTDKQTRSKQYQILLLWLHGCFYKQSKTPRTPARAVAFQQAWLHGSQSWKIRQCTSSSEMLRHSLPELNNGTQYNAAQIYVTNPLASEYRFVNGVHNDNCQATFDSTQLSQSRLGARGLQL